MCKGMKKVRELSAGDTPNRKGTEVHKLEHGEKLRRLDRHGEVRGYDKLK